MAAQDESKADGTPSKADERRARLERALRANLLKRKDKAKGEAKTKAGKAPPTPPEEGRQS